jgi:hypothetical protein
MQETKVYLTFEFNAKTDSKFESKLMVIEGLIESLKTDLEEYDIYTTDVEWK